MNLDVTTRLAALSVEDGRPDSGRRTIVRAIAKAVGRGVLELGPDGHASAGALATALHALPVDVLDLAPGQTESLLALAAYDGPRAAVLGLSGGVSGALAELQTSPGDEVTAAVVNLRLKKLEIAVNGLVQRIPETSR